MNKDKFKNFTVIDGVKPETENVQETSQNTYQSNPLKTEENLMSKMGLKIL